MNIVPKRKKMIVVRHVAITLIINIKILMKLNILNQGVLLKAMVIAQ